MSETVGNDRESGSQGAGIRQIKNSPQYIIFAFPAVWHYSSDVI